jgi:hypothetical protein
MALSASSLPLVLIPLQHPEYMAGMQYFSFSFKKKQTLNQNQNDLSQAIVAALTEKPVF